MRRWWKSEHVWNRFDDLADEWDELPHETRVALMLEAPDLYRAISRVARWWQVERDYS